MAAGATRHLLDAELLSIGTEITVGDTRDTNGSELARSLTEVGTRIGRLTALPDDLAAVTGAFADGLERADLVVSTGGLGPTPDDLTREAIAATTGEIPTVDASLEMWLRALWERRGIPFPELNLKQAWLIPSATPIPNDNGTAPGWWVARSDGRVVVALPGPPREMRPMWHDWVLPRLRERGIGSDVASRTYRLTGIGESAVADLLGEAILRAPNPSVATYARAEAVDVRISASAAAGKSGEALVAAAEEAVLAVLGGYVWATGATSWAEAIAARLAELDWTIATWEAGTGGTLAELLGNLPALVRSTIIGSESTRDTPPADAAAALQADTGADVTLAVRAAEHGADTTVSIAVATLKGVHRERRMAFLGGSMGRSRAALLAVAVLLERLREPG